MELDDFYRLETSQSPKKLKKSYKCTFDGCTASFCRPHKLEAHIRKHNGERPFECDFPECSKTYTNSSHLKRHKVTAHENIKEEREYICGEKGCKLVFANKYALQKHMRRYHHEDNFPFKCTKCSEKFKKRKHFSEHFNLEHDSVPYRCESCQISFMSLIQYTKHKRNHRTFTCDCEKQFDRWTNFCEHRRTDCPLKQIEHTCVICKKTFKTKRNLKTHCVKIHVEESQREGYKCPYLDCKRSYQYKRNLNYHIAFCHEKYMKDMQIKCTHAKCDVVFKAERYLYRHLELMHGEKIKKQKPKKPRKDTGKKKFCMAALLSGIKLTPKGHLELIKTNNISNKDLINLTSLKISIPKTSNCDVRNHISEALKIGSLKGTIRIPKTENHLQGKMLLVVVTQDPIHKLFNHAEVVKNVNNNTPCSNDLSLDSSKESPQALTLETTSAMVTVSLASKVADPNIEQYLQFGTSRNDITEESTEFCKETQSQINEATAISDSILFEQCEEILNSFLEQDENDFNSQAISNDKNTCEYLQSTELGTENQQLLFVKDDDSNKLNHEESVIVVEIDNDQNKVDVQNISDTTNTTISTVLDAVNILPQAMVELDEETKKMLIDSNSTENLNNVESILINNENSTLSTNGDVIKQHAKIVKVVPIKDLEVNVSIFDTQIKFNSDSDEPINISSDNLNKPNGVNSEHVRCNIVA